MKNSILLFILFIAGSLSAQTSVTTGCVSGDCENGYGKYVFEDNSSYEGYFKNSSLEGMGAYTFANGIILSGNWVQGSLEGEGTCTYTDGSVFKGTFKAGVRQGFGILSWPDGTRQEGYWNNNETLGNMSIWFPNGERYVGEMKGGSMHGKGTYYDKSGKVVYDGLWKDNQRVAKDENTTEKKTATDDEFCTVLKQVMDLEKESFNSIRGELLSTVGDMFKTYKYSTALSMPGAVESYISRTFSQDYFAIMGNFENAEEAGQKFNEVLAQLKACFTDRSFDENNPDERSIRKIEFRKQYDDGFEQYGHRLTIFKNDKEMYQVMLLIASNSFSGNARVYRISGQTGIVDEEFATGLKTIMASAPDEFSAVKGEKKIRKGTFWDHEWYELNVGLPGARELTIPLGGFLGTEVKGIFFSSADSMQALAAYEKLLEKTKNSLGNSYCYIPGSGSIVQTVFALESEWKNEKTAVVTVKLWNISGEFSVELWVGYKRFGGIF